MEGKMTYTGIAVFVLAFILKDVASTQEIQATLNAIVKVVADVAVIVGAIMAWYGRWRIYRAKYRDGGTHYGNA